MIIFWDEMQFWILQFCQTRFWSVTIFRFMMSHHFWVTISDSSLWLILFSSFSTRLKLYILFIFNLQVYLHWLFSKWQNFIFQEAQKCQIKKLRTFSHRLFLFVLIHLDLEWKWTHITINGLKSLVYLGFRVKNDFDPFTVTCFHFHPWFGWIKIPLDKLCAKMSIFRSDIFLTLFEFSNFSVILDLTVSPSP